MSHDLVDRKCVPCEGGMPPLGEADENKYLEQVPQWRIIREDTHRIERLFKFKNFKEAMIFVNNVVDLAEEEGHHPDIEISWNKVTFTLWTHAIGGLSENDFIMAAKIDRIAS
jgi:4a-hydroxytetrahydrobiopterin dehydratase